jgi:uncharacterized protein YsxB (DUF464 family)
MMVIKYSNDRDKRECSLRVKGHAGQAELGQDIICASASILAYTVAQELKHMEYHRKLAKSPHIDLRSGDTNIVCCARDDKTYEEMLHTFHVISVGYALLAHNYPLYVKFITDGEAE